MALGFGALLGGASLASSLFGGGKKGGSPESQTQYSGYAALPQEGKDVYNDYFRMLHSLSGNPIAMQRMGMAQRPNDMFGSQELYDLQQTQPNQGVRPIGVLEPFNQVQRQALGNYAQPDYSDSGLADYMLPFQNARNRAMENINRSAGTAFAGIKGREARTGSLARDQYYGDQLPQLEEARTRAMLDAEAGYANQALGLRKDSLADMMNSGNLIQKQNQAGLQAASGQSLAASNPAYGQAQAFMQLLAGMPNSSTGQSTGAVAGRDSNLTRAGNLGMSLFGNQFSGMFG